MDTVLLDGDQAVFLPVFGAAVVVVRPGVVSGSGPATLRGVAWCVDGDEASVSVPFCQYFAGPYAIPGAGTIEIQAIKPSHRSGRLRNGGAAVLLVGQQFDAKLTVEVPAMQPTGAGPQPDPNKTYQGVGRFLSRNVALRSQ